MQVPTCAHDIAEQETACADGYCPLCAGREIERLRVMLADTIPALERHWEMCPGGPRKSDRLALLRRVREMADGGDRNNS